MWEHEERFQALQRPEDPEGFMPEELGSADLIASLSASADVTSAYSAESGFKTMSAHDLALQIEARSGEASGAAPFILDVRTRQEFVAGAWC